MPDEEEIRLIEVTASVSNRGEVLPFGFSADPPEIPYPSVIILLGIGDWEHILNNNGLAIPSSFVTKTLV